MGVTYKAFDINLRCPVTLKVISEQYVGDESAQLRFLREARAAASVRHPNVASVFHLGTTGQNYFYAMEFVEGETLAKLIKRLARLEAACSALPYKVFDARWAMTLMDEGLARLRQEYAGQGKTSIFETLKSFIDPINSKAALSYEQVADTLQVRVESVKKLIFRLRKRYASVLREEVARTVSDSGEVDEEIHSLCEALIVTEGRLGP
jgi:hypothetical protein